MCIIAPAQEMDYNQDQAEGISMDITGGFAENMAGRIYGAAGKSGAYKVMSHGERSALAERVAQRAYTSSARIDKAVAGGFQGNMDRYYPRINDVLTTPGRFVRGGALGRNRNKIIGGGLALGGGVGAASG